MVQFYEMSRSKNLNAAIEFGLSDKIAYAFKFLADFIECGD